MAIWGTTGGNTDHIRSLEARVKARRFPVTVECDWNVPSDYEQTRFAHGCRVDEDDYFFIMD